MKAFKNTLAAWALVLSSALIPQHALAEQPKVDHFKIEKKEHGDLQIINVIQILYWDRIRQLLLGMSDNKKGQAINALWRVNKENKNKVIWALQWDQSPDQISDKLHSETIVTNSIRDLINPDWSLNMNALGSAMNGTYESDPEFRKNINSLE